MKILLMIVSIGVIVFLAGCAKEKSTELQFKNDVVTIPKETYFVTNVAPYEKGETSIQFDVRNNGDQKIPYLEIDFFDVPGFEVIDSIKCEPIGKKEGTNKCVLAGNDALESLDVRSITIQLKSTEDVNSPTPHTVSFAVRYNYSGSRDISIPVIDSLTRKQPLTKFRQNEPSTGPIVLDIDPSIEREVVVGDKTIREYWGIGGNTPLPFSTKFKFRHVGSLEKFKEVNISAGNIMLSVNGLSIENPCDFGNIEVQLKSYPSTKSVLIPFDTLLCTFKPNIIQPEYSATISATFTYRYEFIKSQDFVIQPLPE